MQSGVFRRNILFKAGCVVFCCSFLSSCGGSEKDEPQLFTVSASSGSGGGISPSSHSVQSGQTITFTVTPDTSYSIASVTGCNGSLSGNTYTTAAITAACTINASFTFVPIGGLNDTGIDWCADGYADHLDCPVVYFEGQDGEFGRDAKARAGTLTKIGGGAAGFDYSKLGTDGKVLAIQNVAWNANGTEAAGSKWSCVRDNVTGLIWEVKTTDGGLRDMNLRYPWYNPDMNTNGGYAGYAGTQNGHYCESSYCNTHAFVQAVNRQGLCGATDWRMPTKRELKGIVYYGQWAPAIDTAYFPNTTSDWFWSSSPYADHPYGAWSVGFSMGISRNDDKLRYRPVRLVRVGQ